MIFIIIVIFTVIPAKTCFGQFHNSPITRNVSESEKIELGTFS